MDQGRILALKKKAEQDDLGPFGRASKATDEYLQEKVVNPLTEKGYPNVGAGLATVPASAMQFLANREKENARPDAIMAGEGVTGGKMGEPGSRLPKEVYDEFFDKIAPIARGDTAKFNSAMAQMEKAWLAQSADAGVKAATSSLGRADKMKAEEGVRALFAKQKPDAGGTKTMDMTSKTGKAQESAKQYESAADERARTNRKK